jgi:hypothetical protein
METWAPSRISSFQTGATQSGSFALSLRGLNAGFLLSCFLAAGSSLTAVVLLVAVGDGRRVAGDDGATFFFGAAFFFDLPAALRGRLRFEFLRLAMECPPATRTMDRSGFV